MAEPRNRQDRIREEAFLLWNADGRPGGKADEYWFRAEKTIDGLDRLSHEEEAPRPIVRPTED